MIFRMLMKPILVWAHQHEIRLHAYLDNWLLRHTNQTFLLSHLDTTVCLLTRLGLGVNPAKSHHLPARTFDFLGATLDTVQMTIAPTAQRTQDIIKAVSDIFQTPSFTARILSKCFGKTRSRIWFPTAAGWCGRSTGLVWTIGHRCKTPMRTFSQMPCYRTRPL